MLSPNLFFRRFKPVLRAAIRTQTYHLMLAESCTFYELILECFLFILLIYIQPSGVTCLLTAFCEKKILCFQSIKFVCVLCSDSAKILFLRSKTILSSSGRPVRTHPSSCFEAKCTKLKVPDARWRVGTVL